MKYRSLGRTGWQVSEIGFGAWGIGGGWGPLDDAEARRALHRYLDLGGNFIDTAYGYGDGHSERLIGEVLKERRAAGIHDTVYIASKVPPKTMQWPLLPHLPVTETFPVDWVIQCTERTLQNLGVETLDLQQLHAWTDGYNEQLDWYEALVTLRGQGKVRAFGVSINDYVPETGVRLAQSGRVDAIQVIYNIFEQTPEEALFPAAMENGVGILPRVPFEEGALTGTLHSGTTFDPDDWRGQYFTPERLQEIERRTAALRALLTPETPTLPLLALRFCLHHPAVSSVLPGMRRVAHVEQNMAASDAPLSPEVLQALRAHDWDHGWRYPWTVRE
ncbi:MAG: aldo/keto reductase [Chloroherpetonaceae bacterium]|nr:aldo/keto reductase [Chthonomonadaceae bacterium]MDW8209438.1 aldo/keto reductase [Chloroherpetonaceae bacterium]